ncbi:unnamed protein product [Cuscuta campestris]|uniref:Uncharacterized protein n=1 Tax=Cuscuta campestris TaxID=132261 RepID=A0A484MFS1_9ASTE|nr:unnamed protein product [Cuscuta campestris]
MSVTSSGGASGQPPSSTPSSSHPNSSNQSLHGKSSAPLLQAASYPNKPGLFKGLKPGKSYAAATIAQANQVTTINLPHRSVDKFKGLPCISFSKEEVENLAAKFSKALVGTFFFNRPSLDFIRTTLERMGFIGFSVTLIDSTHILLNFSSDDDFHRCFKQREWSLGAYKMLISKWTPNFDPNIESPIMPIWISIKNLPIHFHAKESLMQIARIFGNPIKLDSTTKNFGRPSIARICVEVDISQPQTNKFVILNGEQPVLLEAFYEEVPLFCPECKGISRHKESYQILTAHLTCHISNLEIFISGIYGKHTIEERKDLWGSIMAHSKKETQAWILGGDFNTITSLDHYKGKSSPNLQGIQEFDHCIMESGLISPPFSGNPFTWTGIRSLGRVWKRLDRVFVNNTFLDNFQEINSMHISRGTSDHCPILVKASNPTFNGPRPFRFLNCWPNHPTFKALISRNWGKYSGGGMRGLMNKLFNLRKELHAWNGTVFGNIFSKTKDLESSVLEAELLYDENPSTENRSHLHHQKALLIQATNNEFTYWKQKASIKWIREGDCNTSFFHSIVKERRISQKIHKIRSGDGQWIQDKDDLLKEANFYFQQLYSKKDSENTEDFLSHIPNLLTVDDNSLLTQLPNEKEVKDAIWNLDPQSVAGPDGFTGEFYKSC